MQLAAIRSPRVTLVNLDTQQRLECLINPETLTERMSALYRRLSVPGLARQLLQYDSTSNRVIPGVEFVVDKRLGVQADEDADVTAFRDFLRTVARPAQAELPSAPPSILFVWPEVLAIECVLTEVEFRYRRSPQAAPCSCTPRRAPSRRPACQHAKGLCNAALRRIQVQLLQRAERWTWSDAPD